MRSEGPGTGPVTAKLADRSPFGAIDHLDHEGLVAAQRQSAAAPRRRTQVIAGCPLRQ
jgi:hypothetical protein